MQQPVPDPTFVLRPGNYGWIEQLAGSCFVASAPHNSLIEECFAIRDGRFHMSSRSIYPRFEHGSECVLQSAKDGTIQFDCVHDRQRNYTRIAYYEGEALVFPSRAGSSRAAGPSYARTRTVWRRQSEDRLMISVEMADDGEGWRPSPLSQPRVLVRRD